MKKLISTALILIHAIAGYTQGFYIEMKMSGGSGKEGISGTMKSYSQDGNNRSEMNLNMAGGTTGLGNIVMLTLKDKPETVYMLNEKDKTYSELSSATGGDDMKDYPQNEYEVTLVGKEKVNNFNCTHVRVKRKGSTHETEMWTSTDLAGYAEFAKVKTKYTGKINMFKALEAKGAVGFPVRIKADEHGQAVQIDLVKAERRTNPASMFSLTGYTKSEGLGNVGGVDVQEMLKKIQNMSPAERELWMKKMQEQYQNHPPH